MRESGIAVFEGKIIIDAQPPISEEQIAQLEKRITAPLPADLLALWRTCYGGTVDYDGEADFDGHIAHLDFKELFYPNSDGYHDLYGWIEHEEECAVEAAQERGETWSGSLEVLPFGGFEYLSRLYVVLTPGSDCGKVILWHHGLPPAWKGRLHHDSVTSVAASVRELFASIGLNEDPTQPLNEYASGIEIVEALKEFADEGTDERALADKLTELLRAGMFDWEALLEADTLLENSQMLRLALDDIVRSDDLPRLEVLVNQGFDIQDRYSNGANLLDMSAEHKAWHIFDAMLERGVSAENTLLHAARNVSAAQAEKLVAAGASITIDSINEAIDHHGADAGIYMAERLVAQTPSEMPALVQLLEGSAQRERAFARKMDSGQAGSFRSADETRLEAHHKEQLVEQLLRTSRKGLLSRLLGR